MIIRGLANLRSARAPCAVSIGNFDGVHLGHQAIISQLLDLANKAGLPAWVVIFEPQPKEYFMGDQAPTRLTSTRQKYELLAAAGIERLLILPFNQQLAELTAPEFIQQILVEQLDARIILIGDDFRFGAGREGDYSLLKQVSTHYGYVVHRTRSVMVDSQRVSSTALRDALAQGDFQRATRMMGREYSIAGRVLHGDKRGRVWGFPTVNIAIRHQRPALTGIYAVEVLGLNPGPVQGVASLGVRPTVDTSARSLLEVYLFNFDREVYGHRITVVFKHKLRDEKRFDSVDELKRQIARDSDQAQAYFNEKKENE